MSLGNRKHCKNKEDWLFEGCCTQRTWGTC